LKLKIDLHVHSKYSIDSANSIDSIIHRCIQEKIDGFALTDHDTMRGLEEVKKSDQVLIIPGVEISAKGAHIICLNPTKLVNAKLSIKDTVDQIHSQGSLAILAHPFSLPKSWVHTNTIFKNKFDGIETKNSSQLPFHLMEKYNIKLAESLNLPKTAGSDSHIPETIGKAYTIIDTASKNIDDIIKAIQMGKTETYGCGITLGDRLVKIKRLLFKN